jgi:hypothetical protein
MSDFPRIAVTESPKPPPPEASFRQEPVDTEVIPRADRFSFSSPAYQRPAAPEPPTPEQGDRFWIPAGQAARVGMLTLPGGLLYVGHGLPAVYPWRGPEPALIDPSLSVAWVNPERGAAPMGYWPSYSNITPSDRAAYLDWLQDGRRDPAASIGHVFLFFYGLERRFLFDAQGSVQARAERELLLAEAERLLGIYGGYRSFRGYVTQFLEIGRLLGGPLPRLDELHPPAAHWGEGSSFALRLGLGMMSAAGAAVPPDWAYAWLISRPDLRMRTPFRRCPEEVRQLFEIRYREKLRDGGLKPRPGKARLRLDYYPASPTFPGGGISVVLPQNLPDVSEHTAPLRKLQEIFYRSCDELDAYSRRLGRTGDSTSPAALALLPPELIRDREGDSIRQLRQWLESRLGSEDVGLIDLVDLAVHWPCQNAGRLTRREAETLGGFLASLGFGIEPDPRFGNTGPVSGQAVLFRFPAEVERPPNGPTAEYQAAALLLHLAAAVSTADGSVTAAEERHLAEHLENALHLEAAERVRLKAHLRWLLASPPGLNGVKKRIGILPESYRRSIGQFLITVAGADGSIGAEELKLLTQIYGLLGLEAQSVYSDVHALASAAAPPASDAITVRPAAPSPGGFALPAAPGPAPAAPAAGISLDLGKIREKLAETERVSNLLGGIFQEEPTAPAAPPRSPAAQLLAGLDAAHSALLRQLAARPVWPRLEVERLAGALGLLPEGALEVINEAAFERCGSALLEGNETIEIDPTVLEEILA